MAKKVKKRHVTQKEKRGQRPGNADSDDEATPTAPVKDRGTCSHITRGINLDKISAKLRSSDSIKCEDCRGIAVDKRANRKDNKHGKKGVGNSKSDSKAIWMCLECGNFSCGGVGFPTTPQSHAVRHSKQNRHAFAVHYENHQQLWCFPCDKLIAAENFEGIDKLVKLLQSGRGAGSSTVDVEDVWFGIGESDFSSDRESGYLVKGLDNLGNTCFFNSVMQNLLAINSLRDYFYRSDESVGPLTTSLKKLFSDTSAEAGLKGVINPKSLFNSLCSKAPQFRGYQQHDSHELLRCLLDCLSTEELSARKSSQADEKPSITDPTFVDTIFGGQLSSTVTCLECGHSSAIHEPFLDLSLPVPHKKPPPKRDPPPVVLGKKPKLPPKRTGRAGPKIIKDSRSIPVKSGEVESKVHVEQSVLPLGDSAVVSDSIDSNSVAVEMGLTPRDHPTAQWPENQDSIEVQSKVQAVEQLVLPSGDSAVSDSIDSNSMAAKMGLTAQDLSTAQRPENQESVENVEVQSTWSDTFSWLDDYLDPTLISNGINVSSKTVEILINQGSVYEDVLNSEASFPMTVDTSARSDPGHAVSETSSDSEKHFNSLEQGEHQSEDKKKPISQFLDDPSAISQLDGELSAEGPLPEEVVQRDADFSHSSASCNEVSSKNFNLDMHDLGNHVLVQDSDIKEDVSSNVEALSRDIEVSYVVIGDEQYVSSNVEATREIEVSFAAIGDEQDSSNFDGIGDLFNEPEATEASDSVKSGVVIGNSSDSDPSEVDDTNAPISVESCLSFFTKKELLSKDEHAWQCDNCSKILREKITKSSRQVEKHAPEGLSNGFEGNGNVEEDVVEEPETEMNVMNCDLETKEVKTVDDKCGSKASDEEANSENLKVKRDATKTVLINKVPFVLTIHLKRFGHDARGRLCKLNGHVNFRETIDLKPYMDRRCIGKDTLTYRLIGVVEHSGTMRGGHYVAYVRGTKSSGHFVWYYLSDSYVRECPLDDVLRCEAYILFYETY